MTDADGKSLATGYVRTYPNPRPKDWEGNQPRNFELQNGQCFVPLSNFDEQKSFKMVFYADGFTPYERTWSDTNVEKLPKHYVHKLTEPAAEPIGGIVRDEDGKPVENAEVYFAVNITGRRNNPDAEPFNTYAQWIKTDAEGCWQYAVLPKEQLEQNFDMTIEHPNYPKFRISKGQLFKDYQAKDADGRFSKTVTISKGLPLKGIVTDEHNNPVEGVLVYSSVAKKEGIALYGTTRTNAQGEFLFENCSPKDELDNNIAIGVAPKNFAPDIIEISKITAGMEPVKIVLKHGKKLVIKMVDKDGKPVSGLKLMSRSWRKHCGNSLFRLFEDADDYGIVKIGDDGLFVWENATEDSPAFVISGGDKYQNVEIDYDSLKFGGEENIITFLPVIHVTGNVTDAETGQPVPAFQVTEWFTFKKLSHLTKEYGAQTGKDGKFTRVVGRRFGEFDKYYLRVDAEGYEGLMSENIPPDAVEPVLNFPLKKAGTFSNYVKGTVLLPDGTPAANTVIGFSTTAYSVQTENGRLSGCNDRQQTRTDTEGKFSISKSNSGIGDQDYLLIFLHDKGQKSIRKEDFEKNTEPIRLEAWSRIEGTVLVGKKPGSLLPVSCSVNERGYSGEIPQISHFYTTISCDENGKFVIDRVFPGKGQIGRAAKLNDSKVTAPFLMQEFNLKPGETLQVVLGVDGGYAVKGIIYIPTEFSSKIDWNFANVTAVRVTAELIAVPEPDHSAYLFFKEPLSKPELNTGRANDPFEVEKIINEWIESPEGKAAIDKDPEGYKNAKLQFDIYSENEKKRYLSERDCRICQVGENGRFQLDDLTPGLWTFEVTLNFPSKPGQWWDYADVWRKKVIVLIPQLPDDQTDKPLSISYIIIGFDKGERKGPQQ
ncbi:MAG: hypothetical protein LBU34_09505 [Planctomycetaceae bacterium]|nr:hypothetical protein [Planctomycetaceae bacterium]